MNTDLSKKITSTATNLLHQQPLLGQRISQHVDAADVEDALIELLKFLHINAATKQKRTPSIIVDLIWHEFILFTKLYTDFCFKHYGCFVHHFPGGKKHDNQQQYVATLTDIQHTFASINETYWPIPAMLCFDVQCGSCD